MSDSNKTAEIIIIHLSETDPGFWKGVVGWR